MGKKLAFGMIRFSGSLPLLNPIYPILNSGCKIWDITGSMISHLGTIVGIGRNGKYCSHQSILNKNTKLLPLYCMVDLPQIPRIEISKDGEFMGTTQ